MNVNLTILKRVGIIAILAIVVAAVAVVPTTPTTTPTAQAQGGPSRQAVIDPALAAMLTEDPEATAHFNEQLPIRVVFDAPAAAEINPGLTSESFEQAERASDAPLLALESMGYDILARHTMLINAVQIYASRADIARIAAIPGVASVEIIPILEGHNATSVPFINADDWWAATGNAGQGTTVAVIDSGVNYNHMTFGNCTLNRGTAGVVASAAGVAVNPLALGAGFGDEVYTGNGIACKVVGGVDFYTGDDDPMGCNPTNLPAANDDGGHGTHVAGSAVGYGVIAGTTYNGAYDASTYSQSFDIGPGVAPGADLLAVRVLGCSGSTGGSWVPDPVTMAIEWSVANGADVINMSLGSSFNNGAYEVVINNATAAGTIVVASAGNSGDAHYITGSPSGASTAISVAASDHRTDGEGVELAATGPSFSLNLDFLAVGTCAECPPVPPSPGLTAPVSLTTPADGCSAITENLTGKIALVERGVCSFDTKIVNAQNQGAVGVIIWNATNGSFVNSMTAPNGTVPSVFIGLSNGTALRNAVQANPADSVTTTMTGIVVSFVDTIANFTSRGPRRAQHGYPVTLKPDIAAPGTSIESSIAFATTPGSTVTAERPLGEPHTGTAVTTLDGQPYNGYPPVGGFDPLASAFYGGTSMSSPHIAGVMALLTAEYGGTMSALDMKALAMNNTVGLYTVTGPNPTPIEWGPSRVGAGRIEFSKLLSGRTNETIAYSTANPELVSLSWGNVEVVNIFSEARSVTVENFTGSARTYNLSYHPANTMAGVTFNVPGSVNVPANSTATFNVTLEATAALMTASNTQDPASTQLLVNGHHWLTEAGGYVELTPVGGGPVLRLPVYALVRRASNMTADDTVTLPDTFGNTGFSLAGTDIPNASGFPNEVTSMVVPFEYVPGETAGDTPNFGYPTPFTDIEYMGVTERAGIVYFGFNTAGEWSVTQDVEFDVYLSVCQDGYYDFILFNSRGGTGNEDNKIWSFIDVYNAYGLGAGAALTLSAPINDIAPTAFSTYVFNNDSLILPADMGFFDVFPSCQDGILDYYVETYDNYDFGALSDTVGSSVSPLSYNFGTGQAYEFAPQIGGLDIPVALDWNGNTIPFDYNVVGLNPVPDILLLHLHNANNTAEIIDVELDPAYQPIATEFAIGGWTDTPDGGLGADGGDFLCSNDNYDELLFETSSNSFDVIHRRWSGGGSYAVEVDGVLARTVNTNGGDALITESFTGFTIEYHIIRIYPTPGSTVCIDVVVADMLPSAIPTPQNWIRSYTPTGNDLGTTVARATCAIGPSRAIVYMTLDGLSVSYDLSILYLDEGQTVLSQQFPFAGLGYSLSIPFGIVYHNGATTDVPGHLDVVPRPASLVGTAEIVVQMRDATGNCDAVTLQYTCNTPVATISQNRSTCVLP